jgi:orotidine-5'-phosphate decarboxylase
MALDRLIQNIVKLQNPTVAGLDPKLDYIPNAIKEKAFTQHGETLDGAAAALLDFNKGLIDALCGIVPAIKPQCAYYEMYGWQGVKALYDTISYAKEKGMFVITDGKRNDIGTTMQAYAVAHLGKVKVGGACFAPFGGDALTVNPYLGSDGINPLLDTCKEEDKGIFVLVKTSNPSSGELQNQIFEGGETLYGTVGRLCEEWGESLPGKYGYSGVGAVVGATYPAQLAELRNDLTHTFFLVPGYGAQGGGAKDVVPAFDSNGLGAVINASRSILCAWQKTNAPEQDYAKAAAQEAIRMRDEIITEIGAISFK